MRLGHQMVRADAGTGKTYTLALRYLTLVSRGVAPERILATTFTRKAAGEILDRILGRLARAVLDSTEASRLLEELGLESESPEIVAGWLELLCSQLHRLQIETLDAFFLKVVSGFGLDLGIDSLHHVGALTDPPFERARASALEAAMADLAMDDFGELVRIVEAIHRGDARRSLTPRLERTLLELHDLFREAPNRETWSGPTVPDTALEDDELRSVEETLAQAVEWSTDQRFRRAIENSVVAASVGAWDMLLERGIPAKILEAQTSEGEVTELQARGQVVFGGKPVPAKLDQTYRRLVGHAKSALLAIQREQTVATWRVLERYTQHLARRLDAEGSLLFGDLPRAFEWLAQQQGGERALDLLFRLDARVEHILLDEFQDTSREQWRALDPLVEEILAWGDGSRTLFAVGDPKQAIYGWRGGCVQLFEDLESRVAVHGTLEQLDWSWRSVPAVLESVNRLLAGMVEARLFDDGPEARAISRFAGRFGEHQTHRADEAGHVTLRTSRIWEAEFAADFEPDKDPDIDAQPRDHLDVAAARVAALAAGFPDRTIGVLTLTNRTVLRLLSRLRALGLSASGEGGGSILDDAAVTAALSALRLAEQPGDTASAYHVMSTPLGELLELRRLGQATTVARRIREEWFERGPLGLIGHWRLALARHLGGRRQRRFEQLLDLVASWKARPGAGPGELASHVSQATVEEPEPSRVRVMTVHRAKGLEFEIVVACELERRLGALMMPVVDVGRERESERPSAIHRATKKVVRACSQELRLAHDQEVERRVTDDLGVLYVAMTRAREQLHLLVQPVRTTKSGSPVRSQTLAELLRRCLAAQDRERWGEGEIALFEAGSPPRSGEPEAPEASVHENRLTLDDAPKAVEPQIPRRRRRRRVRRIIRPAQREPGVTSAHRPDESFDLRELLRPTGTIARQRGVFVHRCLEGIEWLDDQGGVDVAALTLAEESARRDGRGSLAASEALETERRRRWLAELQRWLRDPEILSVFRKPGVGRGESYRLWRERRFAVALADGVLSGSFDRAVIYSRKGSPVAADLYDFKTDRLTENGLAAQIERHTPQVESYRNALAALTGLLPSAIRARLVLLSASRVVEV